MEIEIEANDLIVFSTAIHAGGGLDATNDGVWDHVFHCNFERIGTFPDEGNELFYVTPRNGISEEHVLKLEHPPPPPASVKIYDCQNFVHAYTNDIAKAYVWGVEPCGGPCESVGAKGAPVDSGTGMSREEMIGKVVMTMVTAEYKSILNKVSCVTECSIERSIDRSINRLTRSVC